MRGNWIVDGGGIGGETTDAVMVATANNKAAKPAAELLRWWWSLLRCEEALLPSVRWSRRYRPTGVVTLQVGSAQAQAVTVVQIDVEARATEQRDRGGDCMPRCRW